MLERQQQIVLKINAVNLRMLRAWPELASVLGLSKADLVTKGKAGEAGSTQQQQTTAAAAAAPGGKRLRGDEGGAEASSSK